MDAIVFQMGKVASTAIKQSLRRHGIDAVQTHWLGREMLNATLNQKLLNIDIDEFRALGNLDGYQATIRKTRTLLWYQKYKQHNGNKLKIVTLARDPLDRYWSHLAQNFERYRREIGAWYASMFGTSPENIDIAHAASVFHRHLFDGLGNTNLKIDHPSFIEEANKHRDAGKRAMFLPSQIMKIRKTTTWFDEIFQPVIGIDVYDNPEHVSQGVFRYENDYAEVLLIRYEDISGAENALREFFELKRLSLRRANETGRKRLPFDIKAFAANHRPGHEALTRLYDCRYCRAFGYAPKS